MIEAMIAVLFAISSLMGADRATLADYQALDLAIDTLNAEVEARIAEGEIQTVKGTIEAPKQECGIIKRPCIQP